MTAPDMTRIRQDHGLAVERIITRLRNHHRPSGGYVLYDRRTRDAIHEGIQYVLTLQHDWDGLPQDDAIRELGKSEGSIYYPLFSDNPKFWGDCGRCHNRILITAEGICPDCGHELV